MVIDTDLKQMDTAGLRVFLQVFQFITESVEKKTKLGVTSSVVTLVQNGLKNAQKTNYQIYQIY